MSEIVDIDRILQMLPHRWPFVLVDRVTDFTPGERIRGHKCVTMAEPWFQGHFPGHPIMPGVLVIEAIAQMGVILAHVTEPADASGNLFGLFGIDRVKFRRPVTPGDRLELDVTVLHRRARVWKIRGEATVDGEICASAEILAGTMAIPE